MRLILLAAMMALLAGCGKPVPLEVKLEREKSACVDNGFLAKPHFFVDGQIIRFSCEQKI
jgi:hypothetical protein